MTQIVFADFSIHRRNGAAVHRYAFRAPESLADVHVEFSMPATGIPVLDSMPGGFAVRDADTQVRYTSDDIANAVGRAFAADLAAPLVAAALVRSRRLHRVPGAVRAAATTSAVAVLSVFMTLFLLQPAAAPDSRGQVADARLHEAAPPSSGSFEITQRLAPGRVDEARVATPPAMSSSPVAASTGSGAPAPGSFRPFGATSDAAVAPPVPLAEFATSLPKSFDDMMANGGGRYLAPPSRFGVKE